MYQRALVNKYAPVLLTVCRRYVPSPSLAEDALQETFIKIFQYIHKYKPTGSFEGWMRRIAVTSSLQFVQRSGIVQPNEVPPSAIEPVFDADALTYLQAEELLLIIQSLPLGFRTVFNMYAIDGYSHREISQLLGISESASRSQLSRARQQLIQHLKEQQLISV